jgi:signal transduction histidine kinase
MRLRPTARLGGRARPSGVVILAVGLLVLGVSLSVTGYSYTQHEIHRDLRVRFEEAVRHTSTAFELGVMQTASVLNGAAPVANSLIRNGGGEDGFAAGVGALVANRQPQPAPKTPAITPTSVAYVPVMANGQAVVQYRWPEHGSLDQIGADISTDSRVRKALDIARDNGQPSVALRSRSARQIAVYLPIYDPTLPATQIQTRRTALRAWVAIDISLNALVARVRASAATDRGVVVDVYVGNRTDSQLLVTSSPVSHGSLTSRTASKRIDVLGSPWTLRLRTDSSFGGATERIAPKLVLIGGITFSALAFAIVLTVGRSRDRARRAVEVATRDVRKSERELSLLNETLEKRVDERTAALEKEIFERKNAEQSLAEHAHELGRSNAELEQFAYVASHDLRAPLRTMAGFVNLLQRDYASLLDDRGTTYVGFINDGALRMQTLIDDLLEFSRVRTQTKPFSETSLDGIVARATADLAPLIAETNATITWAALPSVPCDGDQMTRLFENLHLQRNQVSIGRTTPDRRGSEPGRAGVRSVGSRQRHRHRPEIRETNLSDLPTTPYSRGIRRKWDRACDLPADHRVPQRPDLGRADRRPRVDLQVLSAYGQPIESEGSELRWTYF